MTTRIDKKIHKLTNKLAALRQEIEALEAKKAQNLTLESAEVQQIAKQIIQLAQKQKQSVRSVASLVVKACQNAASSEKSSRVVAAKYQDPADANNTWSGRGVAPLWMQRYLSAGKSKEEFLIR
jgi:DNA-binding protein H-NS